MDRACRVLYTQVLLDGRACQGLIVGEFAYDRLQSRAACGPSGTSNYCEASKSNQFLPSSIGYYTKGDDLGPNGSDSNFTCDQVTSSTPTVSFGPNVYILENNQ